MDKMEKITFQAEGEEKIDLFVLEQTRIGGINYLLVTEEEDGDGDAYILKDLSQDGEADGIYQFVEDEDELNAVAGVFDNMLDDIDLE